ncbi:MAG: hypothetical protein D6756_10355, partial [Cyanobacteria bacterium J083]
FTLTIPSIAKSQSLVSANFCQGDVEQLTKQMLLDLPHYANRVSARTQVASRKAGIINYVIIAGKAEFEPLEITQHQYKQIPGESPQQVFFTTLERQYSDNKIIESQNYHWLFLAQTPSGWRKVLIYSRYGWQEPNIPPSPPQESSDTKIGQAIELWLRDCRAKISQIDL